LADLDDVGAAVGEELDAGSGGDVAGDDGERGKGGADHFNHVADAGGVTVGGGDGDGVDVFVDEVADMGDDFLAVEGAVGEADWSDGGAGDESEVGVAGGLPAGFRVGDDAVDVGEGDEAAEVVLVVDDEHLVDADVLGEEGVGGLDGVGLELALVDGEQLGAGRHALGDAAGLVTFADGGAGEEADEFAGGVEDREGAEAVFLEFDEGEDVADELVGRDGDGVLDEAVDVALHAGEFFDLVLGRHVVVEQAETAVEGHGDGHARLSDGVHVGGHDRDGELEGLGEGGAGVGVLGEDVRVEGREGDVVEGEGDGQVRGEEFLGRQIEIGVGGGRAGGGGGRGNFFHELPGNE